MLALRDALVEKVGALRARGVIIDVTALDVLDSFASPYAARHRRIWPGCAAPETVIVGIQPDVAFAMVQLGLTLEGVPTALDLEEGLSYFARRR